MAVDGPPPSGPVETGDGSDRKPVDRDDDNDNDTGEVTDIEDATRATRVVLVSCREVIRDPDLDPDLAPLLAALRAEGVDATVAAWDDPAVDWSGPDLAVLRSTWDYPARRADFLAWARAVPRLANPADVVAWNTDKSYLADLARAGVPVVPTRWLTPGRPWRAPAAGEWVVKPAVGAGSLDAARYACDDPPQRRLLDAHVRRLHRRGQRVLLQPYLPDVDHHGETALVFLADPQRGILCYSHAVRKGPMLTGPRAATAGLFVPEQITPRTASAAERMVADRALAAVPGGAARLLYARVDVVPGPDGAPVVLELELTEPSLFLAHPPHAAARFAAAVAAHAGRARPAGSAPVSGSAATGAAP